MEKQNALSLDHRKQLTRVLEHTVDDIMPYYVNTIRAANHQAKLSDQTFWDNLYITDSAKKDGFRWIPTTKPPLLRESEMPKRPVPADPYLHMDIQMCSKYLLFGHERVTGWQGDRPIRIQDSNNFFHYVKMDRDAQGTFRSTLFDAIALRNSRKHETLASYQDMSLAALSKDMETLRQMMSPFFRLKKLDGDLAPARTIVDTLQQDVHACLGGEPVSVKTLCATLFPDSESVAQLRQPHIQKLLRLAGFRQEGDFFIVDCHQDLLTQAVMIFIQKNPGDPTAEDAAALLNYIHPKAEVPVETPAAAPVQAPVEPAAEAPAPRELGLTQKARELLIKCGKLLPGQEQVLEALLEGFHIMADESVFLCTEGRQLLMDLVPIFKKLGLKLQLDYSVIASLYLKYRRTKPLSADAAQVYTTDDTLQQLQAEAHANCRMALKALRRLRENGCMVSVASPIPSSHSYENIYTVAKTFSKAPFLVLSMHRQLSEELATVPGKNAVVAKVTLDGKLLLLGDTYPAWQALLGCESPVPVNQAWKVRVSVSNKQETSVLLDPTPAKTITRLDAVDAAQNHMALTLRKKLGEGGEGAVYETTHPDGLVAKIYHRNKLTAARKEKLLYMVDHNPNIPNLAWPCAMLYTQEQEWVGYLMPKAPGKALEDVVFHPGINWKNIKDMGWSRRHLALIGANISHTFAQMHRQNMLMGDVNPRNIMVNGDCSVYFVDCDSYQFGQYECPVGKPDYTPPEVHIRMRAEGVTEYRYTRTEHNEVYSLAVLLFSILLPGKAPYAARNAGYDDVVDAVIAGYFPYPYGGDENAVPKGNMLAPAGVFRNIWSHMTRQMKTHFYETFTQSAGGRRNAQQWEEALREYIRQIELKHSTDDLEPTGYKDTSREGDESSTKMVDLVCDLCGQAFNLAEDVYQRRQGRFEQNFCGKHYEMMRNFRTRRITQTCTRCGDTYETSYYDLFVRDANDKPSLCIDCEAPLVTCDNCGVEFRKNREKLDELYRRGQLVLCKDCLSSQR